MGTRNLTCVASGGKIRIAQYCQWDGYFSGQGKRICQFIIDRLQTKEGLELFKQHVNSVIPLPQEEVKARWDSVGATDGWANINQSDAFKKKWPQLQRDFGSDILEYVYNQDNAGVPKLGICGRRPVL